jgi:hypothetical protein
MKIKESQLMKNKNKAILMKNVILRAITTITIKTKNQVIKKLKQTNKTVR